MRLVFASNNQHKLAEVRGILPEHDIISLSEIGFTCDIDETGTTLETNSLIKAEAVQQYAASAGLLGTIDGIFSDDTGLEIAALSNQPGVYTARWAGEAHNDAANRSKALDELTHKMDRSARFRTVITLIRNGKTVQVEGIVCGKIADAESGHGGFGYDPIFIPEGYDKTFSELPSAVKNTISHRARALMALREIL